ncbi:cytochrome P450 6k1-like [Planococcus citri]|uniref:cytochrome P450 6k1-like n=1 Tax=Planococcus citri TaxID=170843 RepID=UPI0031F7E6AB
MCFYHSLILFATAMLLYLYWSFKNAYKFFEHRGIPFVKPSSLLFGNMADVIFMRTTLPEKYVQFYKQLAPHKFGGILTMKKPTIVFRDPELIKKILIKDFASFTDRGFNTVRKIEPLSHSLFTMKGDEWKTLRVKLSNSFSSGKMKMMFPILKECGEKLSRVIEEINVNRTFDVKDLASRYTTDTVGSCVLGLGSNSLDNPNSEFRKIGEKIFVFRYAAFFRSIWTNMPETLIKLFNITLINPTIQKRFAKMIDDTIKYREENNISRNDFMDRMIALKSQVSSQIPNDVEEDKDLQKFVDQVGQKYLRSNKHIDITNDLLAAQAFVFFAGGFGVTAITLSNILLELSLNGGIQDKVRQEIFHVLSSNGGELTYDNMKQMTYTDMVIAETLRKYPPAAVLFREAGENYKIPDTDVIIPAGTSIIVPTYGIHLDELFYENPTEFRPERFTAEEKAKRSSCTYLPFGEGPRICIAERFANLQVKVGLIYAIKNFTYRVSPEMKLPMEYRKVFGLLNPESGILLQRQK